MPHAPVLCRSNEGEFGMGIERLPTHVDRAYQKVYPQMNGDVGD